MTGKGINLTGISEFVPSFREELTKLINKHGRENGSNTPDFILAAYLENCLNAFDAAVTERERWHNS